RAFVEDLIKARWRIAWVQEGRGREIIPGIEPESIRALRRIIVVQHLPSDGAGIRVNERIGALDLIDVVGLARPFQMNGPLVGNADGGELKRVLTVRLNCKREK